ncbi:hypothetical protein E1A91_D06G095600v1 [Gossypium mustelinum]|uniref:Uncharacterized protein n=3 Tax=Gossypium TaxID=3633 RepID=A0A5J5R013_GOSBA|nr:hypothetical protein ES319_D06G093600v1 [Gossypium barbadense]TYG64346.1 hypothetical protein ES288_D06G100500v1 [Gossypium darwinii]TYI76712.1 hypothetical protein E1A91_D06G095600v1 [Gossypium mustelinum]
MKVMAQQQEIRPMTGPCSIFILHRIKFESYCHLIAAFCQMTSYHILSTGKETDTW